MSLPLIIPCDKHAEQLEAELAKHNTHVRAVNELFAALDMYQARVESCASALDNWLAAEDSERISGRDKDNARAVFEALHSMFEDGFDELKTFHHKLNGALLKPTEAH